jgi:hypothetical protein
MKNIYWKIFLIVLAFAVLLVVPKNSQLAFGYGTTGTPSCGKEAPDQVVLYEPNHPLLPRASAGGEVLLNWLKAARATKYTVAFGTSSGNYIYGQADVGDTDHFLVRFLTPGRRYYFAVRGVNDCMPGPWSMEWPVLVGGQRILVGQPSTGGYIAPTTVPTIFIPGQGAPTSVPTAAGYEQPTVQPTTVTLPPLPPISPPPPSLNLWQRILRFFGLYR